MGLVLALELIRLLSTVDAVLLVQPDVILQRTILRQAWHNLGRHDGKEPGLTVGALDLKVAASAEVSLLRNRTALTASKESKGQSTKTGSFLSQADRATVLQADSSGILQGLLIQAKRFQGATPKTPN